MITPCHDILTTWYLPTRDSETLLFYSAQYCLLMLLSSKMVSIIEIYKSYHVIFTSVPDINHINCTLFGQLLTVQMHIRDPILQYIPRNMHTVFALLCFVVVIHWLIFPYPSGLLHWHCGNITIAPVPAKQPWWIWINTSCEFIMNDCITTTKQSTTKPCAYFLGYTVLITLSTMT